ncbi:MAG: hypothetical protein D6689_09500 [Deltaproteobacteria bacterium]|nr:MAG: hypothetical protein D6689_09500 [Deltaproteobacteria bacterium]
MSRAACLAGLAVLAAAAPAVAGGPAPVVERDEVEVAPADGVTVTRVDVDNRLGDVEVRGHDAPTVRIRAVKRAGDTAALDRLKVSLVPDPSGPVWIRTSLVAGPEARPLPAGSVRIDLVVSVPRSARVAATTWNGAVTLADLDAGATVTTNEGDIAIRNCAGPIETRGAAGRQRLRDIFGDVDAEGISGAVELDVVRGDRVGARMHDGAIVAQRVQARTVTLRTTTGDIDFDGVAPPGGTVDIASYSGRVRVALRRGAQYRVDAASRRGRVIARGLALERRGARFVGRYGGGARPAGLVVRSRLGDIEFDVRVGLAEPL